MTFMRVFVILASVLLAVGLAKAENYQTKAAGTVTFQGSLFNKKPKPEVKQEALAQARDAAWAEYVSKMSGATKDLYLSMRDTFISDMDTYVTVTIVSEDVDDSDKAKMRYTVWVRVKIDDSAVQSVLRTNSAAGQQASGEGSPFAFLFVSRDTTSRNEFEDKPTVISASESSAVSQESVAVSGSSVSESSEQSSMQKTTTGGSTEKKADRLQYAVASSQDINAAISNVLVTAGFEIVEYDDVVSYCGGTEREVIMEEFSESDDMSRESRKGAIDGSRDCEVMLFATGTLDIGLGDIDPASGNSRVYVSARAQVWSLEQRLPKKVASVGPVQYAGLGPDDKVAMRNALNIAAKEAANEIVSILNAKGIR